jgi:ABC-2 type transport system permease protein
LKGYLTLVKMGLRAFIRDKSGLFWSFFFPIFFLMLFGSLNSRKSGTDFNFPAGLVVEDTSQDIAWLPKVFRDVKALSFKEGTLEALKEDLRASKIRVIVVIPAGSAEKMKRGDTVNIDVYRDPGQQMSGAAMNIVSGVITGIDLKATQYKPKFATEDKVVDDKANKGKQLSGIDYLLPGILAMTIMQLGLFTAIPIINMREKGILKRLRATPLTRTTVVASTITQRVFIALFQTMIIVILGMVQFHFQVLGSWLLVLGIVLFGVLTFICMGALLSGIAKTQESGVSVVQLVQMPMLFLCNIFLPIDILPKSIQPISKVLPATYLADALRASILNQPATYSLATDLGVMALWFVGSALLAAKLFRWE